MSNQRQSTGLHIRRPEFYLVTSQGTLSMRASSQLIVESPQRWPHGGCQSLWSWWWWQWRWPCCCCWLGKCSVSPMLSSLELKVFFTANPFFLSGRCARCGENVVGEGTGCTAMDQVFHVDCFTCIICNNKLRGQPFYAVEKKAYCEPCYTVSSDLVLG